MLCRRCITRRVRNQLDFVVKYSHAEARVTGTSMARPRVLSCSWTCIAVLVAAATPASAQLRLVPYVSGLSAPLEFVQDPSVPSIQYVVEQVGTIRVIQGGIVLPAPFLDITSIISAGGERGLLGLAFPRDYAVSGRFFVDYTDTSGNTRVARFKRSTVNPVV